MADTQLAAEYVKATSDYQTDTSVANQQQPPTICVGSGRDDLDISSWAQGEKPTGSRRVRIFIRIHAIFMFAFVTTLGSILATGAGIGLVVFTILFLLLLDFRGVYFRLWLKIKCLEGSRTRGLFRRVFKR